MQVNIVTRDFCRIQSIYAVKVQYMADAFP